MRTDKGRRQDDPNENCLLGLACPKCKSRGPFMIVTTCQAEVHDDGIEDTSEHEWDLHSICSCKACKYTGKVDDFEATCGQTLKPKKAKKVKAK